MDTKLLHCQTWAILESSSLSLWLTTLAKINSLILTQNCCQNYSWYLDLHCLAKTRLFVYTCCRLDAWFCFFISFSFHTSLAVHSCADAARGLLQPSVGVMGVGNDLQVTRRKNQDVPGSWEVSVSFCRVTIRRQGSAMRTGGEGGAA